MKSNWRTIAELIGVAAVVVSLLLVVIELQQTQSAISAAAHSDRTVRNLELLQFALEHDYDEIQRLQETGESLTPKQRAIVDAMFQMRLRHFEDLHYQHSIGTVSDETWAANKEGLRLTVTSPAFDRNWQNVRRFYRPSFIAAVEDVASAED